MKIRKICLLIPVLALINACGPEQLNPEAYSAWIENPDNGLNITTVAGEFKFNLQYKPLPYAALINSKEEHIDKEELLKIMEEMKDLQYYTLRINPATGNEEMLQTNLTSQEEYFYRVQYFSFKLKNDLYLKEGNDSLPCVFAHFERSYAVSPNNNFILAFPVSEREKESIAKGKKYEEEKTLVYNDQYLQTGQVKLKIEKSSVRHIPELKL